MGLAAAAIAVALTVALFKTIGPKRTRLIAQIVAAVIGAAFVIGLQLAAILSYGSLSRIDILKSDAVVALAPNIGSIVYWPALAVLGDFSALAGVLATGIVLLGLAIAIFSRRFGDYAIATANVSTHSPQERRWSTAFRVRTPKQVLRRKELTLLRRDPWLASQTLMQILYLLPPAVLLSRNFDEGTGVLLVLVPVLVMAAGQLAGGLAWLAISGEDAPDSGRDCSDPHKPDSARENRSGHGWDHDRILAVCCGTRVPLGLLCCNLCNRNRRGCGISSPNPSLVSCASEAKPFSPPADFVARGDVRGSIFVDYLGCHGSVGFRGYLAGLGHGRDCGMHFDRCTPDKPS